MARFITCGFELNSLTTGHEASTLTAVGSPTIASATKRTGSYALKILLTSAVQQGVFWEAPTALASTGTLFLRFYIYVQTLPNALCGLMEPFGPANLALNTNGTVDLYNTTNLVQAGVFTLPTGSWSLVEVSSNPTTGAVVVKFNGTQVYSATGTASTFNRLGLGGNEQATLDTATAGEWYFDDVAMNDASGAAQNSFPGAGSVCYLRPSADGDANTGAPTRGGADSGAIWSQMEETPPNDATDYAVLPVNPSDVWVNVDDGSVGGILAGASVTLVEVHGRVSAASATASQWQPQIKKAVAGTIAAGASTAWASAAWFTNDDTAGAREAKLTRYLDPDSAAWTTTTIDSMQISAKTVDGNPDTWVSALWAIVEFVNPAASDTREWAGCYPLRRALGGNVMY